MVELPIGYLLKRTHLSYRQRMDAALEALDCTAAMYEVLFHLHHGGPQSASDIAGAAGVTPQTMHRQTRTLQKRTLIRPLDGPGRAIVLELTPQGRTLFERACDELEILEARLVEGLTEAERDVLSHLLDRCERNLDDRR